MADIEVCKIPGQGGYIHDGNGDMRVRSEFLVFYRQVSHYKTNEIQVVGYKELQQS